MGSDPIPCTLQGAPDHEIRDDQTGPDDAVQVFAIELARDTVQDMRKAARGNKPITLSFGTYIVSPHALPFETSFLTTQQSLRYGMTTKPLRANPQQQRQELYEADDAQNLHFKGLVSHRLVYDNSPAQDKATAVPDEALDRMRQQYADIESQKKAGTTNVAHFTVQSARVNRRPMEATASPSLMATTPNANADPVLQAQSFAFSHCLAVGPATEQQLQKKTAMPLEVVQQLLSRHGEKSGTGPDAVWTLAARRFKELDIWAFPYSDKDRKAARENGIHAFDKLRIDESDKTWQKLQAPHERHKGLKISRAGQWPTDHRKILGGIEGGRTPQPLKPRGPIKPRAAAANAAEKKPARKAAPKPAAPTAAKDKKSANTKSSERIEDSDEEFEQARAEDPTAVSESVADSAKTGSQDAATTSGPLSTSPDAPKSVGQASPAPAPTSASASAPTAAPVAAPVTSPATTPATAPVPVAKKATPKAESQRTLIRPADPKTVGITTKKRKAPPTADVNLISTARTTKPGSSPMPESSAPPQSKRPKLNGSPNGATKPTVKAATSNASTLKNETAGKKEPVKKSVEVTREAMRKADNNTPRHRSKLSTESFKAPSPALTNGIRKGTPSAGSDSEAKLNGSLAGKRKAIDTDAGARQNKVQKTKANSSPQEDGWASQATLNRDKTLEQYGRYYEQRLKYNTWRKSVEGSLSEEQRVKDREWYDRQCRRQKDVLEGFEAIVHDFKEPRRGRVLLSKGAPLDEDKAKAYCWEARARLMEWKAKYGAMMEDSFGKMTPDEMTALFNELAHIKGMQYAVLRSVALAYGQREEGYLQDVEIEKIYR